MAFRYIYYIILIVVSKRLTVLWIQWLEIGFDSIIMEKHRRPYLIIDGQNMLVKSNGQELVTAFGKIRSDKKPCTWSRMVRELFFFHVCAAMLADGVCLFSTHTNKQKHKTNWNALMCSKMDSVPQLQKRKILLVRNIIRPFGNYNTVFKIVVS